MSRAFAAVLAILTLALPIFGAQAAAIFELDKGLATGRGYLTDTDATSGGSQLADVLQATGNAITSTETLPTDLSSYDAVWVSYNVGTLGSGSGLSTAEIQSLQDFLAAGKKVVMIGDKSDDWQSYDPTLLDVVGGGTVQAVPEVLNAKPNTLAATPDRLLTDGLTDVRFAGYSKILTISGAGSHETLFNDGADPTPANVDVATLFHTSGNGEALMILDTNWMINDSVQGLNGTVNDGRNAEFGRNIGNWLHGLPLFTMPEPGTIGMFALGLCGLMGLGYKRRRRVRP